MTTARIEFAPRAGAPDVIQNGRGEDEQAR